MKIVKIAISTLLTLIYLPILAATDPVITNLTAMQRAGTQLVDIHYDLNAVTAQVTTSLRISNNSGETFTVPVTTLSGDIGAGTSVSNGKMIKWNAGADWPEQFSQSMRFEVTADDGLAAIIYTAEAEEYFARAGVTDAYSKYSINEFVKGAKQLGIWDKLVYVPCLPSMGGLHQIGGAAQRTNTPWTLVNASSVPEGVAITLNGLSNHLLSDQAVDNVSNPVAWGSFACQTTTPKFHWFDYTTISRAGGTGRNVGQEFWSNPHRVNLRYAHNSFMSATALTGLSFGYNNYKNSHLMALDSTNGSSAFGAICDEAVEARTLGSAVNYNSAARLCFYPAVNQYSAGTGWVQGAFLYYGAFTEAGYEAWGKFRALVAQTFLSGGVGHRRLLLSGQSNAAGNLALEISRQSTEDFGMFSVFNTGIGGNPISTWIGNIGNNSRTASYHGQAGGLWSNTPTQPAFQKARLVGIGKSQEYLVWFQGESDTETAETAAAYRAQLNTLINYIRTDTGNPYLKVIVVQIDYNYTIRDNNSGGFHSNLALTGVTGALSALNGAYTISTLTSHTDPYVWTKAGYKVEEQNNRWVFVETEGNTVVASAVQTNLPHPAMVTNWVDSSNNTIALSFGAGNRIEWTERVRYAQREIVNDLPHVYTIDSRGYERADNVHLTGAAHISFAAALNAYLLTL
jgi:hypothetical protein